MSVNKKRDVEVDGRALGICLALDVINAAPDGEAVVAALRTLCQCRLATYPRWPTKALAASVEAAVTKGWEWFEEALRWESLSARAKARVIAAVGDALTYVEGGAGYFYHPDAQRFELGVAEPVAPPHALMALALAPLFDETAPYRRRLRKCRYRNCGRAFLATGKGQEYCDPAHANLERQYRHRGG